MQLDQRPLELVAITREAAVFDEHFPFAFIVLVGLDFALRARWTRQARL